MSGKIPSFSSGSKLAIRIGNANFAYAQNLSFTDDMAVQAVGGIGAFSYHALEPTGYIGRGSMTITHYSDKILKVLKEASTKNVPDNLKNTNYNNPEADGNSFLRAEYFNPVRLLISTTFDIDVYERRAQGTTPADYRIESYLDGAFTYRMKDCRFTSYSIGFAPGSLVNESVTFICTSIIDRGSEEIFQAEG